MFYQVLHLNTIVKKDWVYRAAFTTSIARPNYYALSPFLSVIPDDDSAIEVGNPNLKATYAYNLI